MLEFSIGLSFVIQNNQCQSSGISPQTSIPAPKADRSLSVIRPTNASLNRCFKVVLQPFRSPKAPSLNNQSSCPLTILSQHFLTLPPALPLQPSHPFPLPPILMLLPPNIPPILYIFHNPLGPPIIHPQCQHAQSTPHHHPSRHPQPEEKGLIEHIEDFEGDEDDEEQEGDGGEVWVLCCAREEGVEVGFYG